MTNLYKFPGWLYDESHQVGTDYTDPAQVEAYDIRMQKLRDIKQETMYILDRLDPGPDYNIIEFGTGTGEFAIEAAKHCNEVIAVDVSPVMVEYARNKAARQGITNISFHNAGFLTYEHRGGPLDAAVSQLALHHLPDFWKMIALRRIFSMLKAGGKFYLMDTVYSFEPDQYVDFFNSMTDRVGQTAGREMANDTEMAIREEFSTFDWIMERLLKKAGFQVESADYHEGFIAIYLCTRR